MAVKNILMPTDITEEMVWSRIPKRAQDSHKGTFGKVLCIAGSSRFRGAAALCTEGALRTGCGIVSLATVEPVFASVQSRMPEAILISCAQSDESHNGEWFGGISSSEIDRLRSEMNKDYDSMVIGPGMGNTPETAALVNGLVSDSSCTVVIDADGLNSIKTLPKTSKAGGIIITPHPGEMARLCGCSIAQIKKAREAVALIYAVKNNCIVVLKEHRTLIATPEGKLYRNTSGNSGLARGGSGDVLAGMIASLSAQGLSDENAAICGVWLHGKAAERCSERKSQSSMLPHDIFDDLGIMMRLHEL